MKKTTQNPFNPNSIVAPILFAGRDEQVRSILKKLSAVKAGMHASFILHGERGIGKTALAKLILHAASAQLTDLHNLHFATSYYSVEKGQSLKSVMESSLNNITDNLPLNILKNLGARLGESFKNGKFSWGAIEVQFSGKERSAEEGKQFFKDQVVSSLSNLIQSSVIANEDNQHKFDGILIVIDEIHNIKDIKGAAQIFRNIINTLDVSEKGYFSFLLVGYGDGVEQFFEGDPSARRSFDFISLDVMPPDEAKELLTKGFDEVALEYEEESLDRYIGSAGGYPHALQMLGHNLVEIDSDNYISNGDWQEAIDKSAKELQSKDFSDLYSFSGRSTFREQIMNVLALPSSYGYKLNVSKSDLAKTLNGNFYNKNYLPKLIKQGAIKEDRQTGVLTLHSKLFETAIIFHLLSQPEQYEKTQELVQKLVRENKSKISVPLTEKQRQLMNEDMARLKK